MKMVAHPVVAGAAPARGTTFPARRRSCRGTGHEQKAIREKTRMGTCIVRIYRNSGMQLVGMLEAVEYGWQRPFRHVTELLAVL
jgi:hypothetical protein